MEDKETDPTESPLFDGRRRLFFKAALGASALSAGIAGAGTPRTPVSWIHGNSAAILSRNQLEADTVQGNARLVQGRSWSIIPLHFAIPTPGFDVGSPMSVNAVWIRLQTGSGGSVAALALHDCELTVARLDGLDLMQPEWGDVRIPLQPSHKVIRSLGVTIECQFSDVDRQIGISAVGCEFRATA